MVPRDEIVAVDADATVADIEEVVRTSGHTRLLVAQDASTGDLDAISGFVHAKDLLRLPALDGERAAAVPAPAGGGGPARPDPRRPAA